jgi:hypothetical protein
MEAYMSTEIKIGIVEKFFSKPSVAAITLSDGELSVGDTIHFKGATTDFSQTVDSMQVDHLGVDKAPKGSSIGIKVKDRVRPNDTVFKVTA